MLQSVFSSQSTQRFHFFVLEWEKFPHYKVLFYRYAWSCSIKLNRDSCTFSSKMIRMYNGNVYEFVRSECFEHPGCCFWWNLNCFQVHSLKKKKKVRCQVCAECWHPLIQREITIFFSCISDDPAGHESSSLEEPGRWAANLKVKIQTSQKPIQTFLTLNGLILSLFSGQWKWHELNYFGQRW